MLKLYCRYGTALFDFNMFMQMFNASIVYPLVDDAMA